VTIAPVAALISAGLSGVTFAQCPGYIAWSCRVDAALVDSRACRYVQPLRPFNGARRQA
jgi:hypothetical protein